MTVVDRAPAAPPADVRAVRWGRGALVVLALLVLAACGSVLVGSRPVPPQDLLSGAATDQAILHARLARTAVALATGAALGLAGALLQGLTRNPLADPGLLGITAGASFAMVVAIAYAGVAGVEDYIWWAFAGAALAALLVHGLASLARGGATPATLVLTGAAVTAGLTSWTSAVLLTDDRTMDVFRFWQVGTVGGRGWEHLATCLPFLGVGALVALAMAPVLDALALGDDVARGLGRRVDRDRLVTGAAVVLLAGAATALAGPVAFVGLVAPHAARALVGSATVRVLPLAAGLGAVLVLVADTVGRVVLPPAEVQVGIMTAVVGVPAFCLLLRRGRWGAR
ncbi:FecCD family ABC transporter permease [Nocardioides sp.]|uniref:FecCD family ABC transporter permease n=1 Tax=Nocardioides sp. TaxID=35761 RepID=UPI003784C63D